MMHHKVCSNKLCRLCGKEKQRGTDLFKDKVKGAVLCSIINKYFSKEVINIGISDTFTKYVCMDCEQKICTFDEFCLMVANVQKQLAAPSLEIDFAEDMLCHLKENEVSEKVIGDGRSKKLHTCQLCAKRFRCAAHLERHKHIHTGQRPFACNICAMSFNQQSILNKHKESHQAKKDFVCANCHQSFRFKVSLRSHMINYHAENDNSSSIIDNLDRSLICADCGKYFATRYKLRRHARCHTGERPYTCNYCNRAFSQTGNLKAHEAKCHDNLAMACQLSRVETSAGTVLPCGDYRENDGLNPARSCSIVDPANSNETQATTSLQHFQPMYITESEIQKTINETINSTSVDNPQVSTSSNSYLIKTYENPIYIDNEIETMLDDRDLVNIETNKFSSPTNNQDKIPLCLKQPETPELLHSLLYDD